MGVGTILLIVFVVMPAVQWSLWGGRSKRRSRKWGVLGSDFHQPGLGEEITALRNDLEGRFGEVEQLQSRVAELENRLDFTERLLAQKEPGTLAKPPVS
jgi:hypothetical protein